jgi:hypothetical protein
MIQVSDNNNRMECHCQGEADVPCSGLPCGWQFGRENADENDIVDPEHLQNSDVTRAVQFSGDEIQPIFCLLCWDGAGGGRHVEFFQHNAP